MLRKKLLTKKKKVLKNTKSKTKVEKKPIKNTKTKVEKKNQKNCLF